MPGSPATPASVRPSRAWGRPGLGRHPRGQPRPASAGCRLPRETRKGLQLPGAQLPAWPRAPAGALGPRAPGPSCPWPVRSSRQPAAADPSSSPAGRPQTAPAVKEARGTHLPWVTLCPLSPRDEGTRGHAGQGGGGGGRTGKLGQTPAAPTRVWPEASRRRHPRGDGRGWLPGEAVPQPGRDSCGGTLERALGLGRGEPAACPPRSPPAEARGPAPGDRRGCRGGHGAPPPTRPRPGPPGRAAGHRAVVTPAANLASRRVSIRWGNELVPLKCLNDCGDTGLIAGRARRPCDSAALSPERWDPARRPAPVTGTLGGRPVGTLGGDERRTQTWPFLARRHRWGSGGRAADSGSGRRGRGCRGSRGAQPVWDRERPATRPTDSGEPPGDPPRPPSF